MKHSHRWRVGKWVKMDSSEHFSAIRPVWIDTTPDLKKMLFPQTPNPFSKEKR